MMRTAVQADRAKGGLRCIRLSKSVQGTEKLETWTSY